MYYWDLNQMREKSEVGKKLISTALNYSKHQTSMLPWGPKSHFLSFSLHTPEKQTHKQNQQALTVSLTTSAKLDHCSMGFPL